MYESSWLAAIEEQILFMYLSFHLSQQKMAFIAALDLVTQETLKGTVAVIFLYRLFHIQQLISVFKI